MVGKKIKLFKREEAVKTNRMRGHVKGEEESDGGGQLVSWALQTASVKQAVHTTQGIWGHKITDIFIISDENVF